MNRMESDMGDLKAHFTKTDLESLAQDLVDLLDLTSIEIVSRATLGQFSKRLQLPLNTCRSFNRADLVCQAQDPSGHTAWCAVESLGPSRPGTWNEPDATPICCSKPPASRPMPSSPATTTRNTWTGPTSNGLTSATTESEAAVDVPKQNPTLSTLSTPPAPHRTIQ